MQANNISKLIIQASIMILLFFGSWQLLKMVDWMVLFRVQKVSEKTEEKLGALFWDVFNKSETENKSPIVRTTLDSIVSKICTANNIDRKKIKVHTLDKDEINAFALPNGHLVIYSGLILNVKNQDELCGVMCHELAHIELRHVMKKLISEVGLSVLLSITTGGGGSDLAKSTAKTLSSTAFDRELEKDADIKAVDYLVKAKVNPTDFANFLYKIGEDENDVNKYFSWVSTHPDSKERAAYIIEYCKDKPTKFMPIISSESWERLKSKLEED